MKRLRQLECTKCGHSDSHFVRDEDYEKNKLPKCEMCKGKVVNVITACNYTICGNNSASTPRNRS